MGLPSAPKMIDLCMAYHEFIFLTNKQNQQIAEAIGKFCCRYVDDFCCLADYDISTVLPRIYPTELNLVITSSPQSMDFLDTTIVRTNKGLETHVYNKTDAFPFSVIRFTHATSDIHESVGYNIFYGELVRYCRICSEPESFKLRAKQLIRTFEEKGYDRLKLAFSLSKFSIRYKDNLFMLGYADDADRAFLNDEIMAPPNLPP